MSHVKTLSHNLDSRQEIVLQLVHWTLYVKTACYRTLLRASNLGIWTGFLLSGLLCEYDSEPSDSIQGVELLG